MRVLERSAKGVLHNDLMATNNYSGENAVTKVQCPTLIIIGEKELKDGKYRIKHMKTGKEELIQKETVINFIKELI